MTQPQVLVGNAFRKFTIQLLALLFIGTLQAQAEDVLSEKPAKPIEPQLATKVPGPEWRKLAEKSLPKEIPSGRLSDLAISINRQIDACKYYRDGNSPICRDSIPPKDAECDLDTLNLMAKSIRQSKTWKELTVKLRKNFDWYELTPNYAPQKMMFTAYNHPSFEGSLTKSDIFKYPVYGKPQDLVSVPGEPPTWKKKNPDGTFSDYYTRKEIDVDKVLSNQNLEVAYMADPVSVMRLQVEGSGIMNYKNSAGEKKEINFGFAATNGLPYKSVFKYLKDKGVDKKYMSFDGLRQYIKDFPDDMWPALTSNPSYAFFSISEDPPCGTARTYLIDHHSLAVDLNLINIGAVGFLKIARPKFSPAAPGEDPKNLSRIALAQDTGSAIIGSHVDIFWGKSKEAEAAASSLKVQGDFYWLIAKKAFQSGRK